MLNRSLVLVLALVLTSSAAAGVINCNMTIDTPTPSVNTVALRATARGMGDSDTDTDAATVSGNIVTALDYAFDPISRAATLNSIDFTGGTFLFSNVRFDFTFLWIFNERVDGAGIGGTFNTPDPPGPVANGQFPASDHEVILNRGTLTMSGVVAQTYNLATNPKSGTTSGTGTIATTLQSVNPTTGLATYGVALTLPLDFDETVYDDGSFSADLKATGTFSAHGTFSVLPENEAPTAVNDAFSVNEDVLLSIQPSGVLANDTDPDVGDVLSAVRVGNPSHGSLTLNADGSFTYQPAANYFGSDSFTYRANDGLASSNLATVSLTVRSVNDRPAALGDSYSIDEDLLLSVPVTGVLGNDSDVEGSALSAIKVTSPAHGSLALNANGSFSYQPAANYFGSDSFTYKAYDGVASSDPVTVALSVNPINDAPIAVNDSYTVRQGGQLVASESVKANDVDVDGDTLSAFAGLVGHGVLVFSSTNGTFSYTPYASFSGTDSFQYALYDGHVVSNEATVTITVIPRFPGDANWDRVVDALDAAILAGHWLKSSGAVWDEGDFNSDGSVNDLDLAILSANWGATASTAVPEPGATLLLLTALAAVCVLWRR